MPIAACPCEVCSAARAAVRPVDMDDARGTDDRPVGEEEPRPGLFPVDTGAATESVDDPDPFCCYRCDRVEDDCECITCVCCDERVGSTCNDCNRCDACCGCITCERCGEHVDSTCNDCDRCDACCGCITCEYCGEHVDSTCNDCDRCDACCGCITCEYCGEHVDSTCNDCDRCDACCGCHGSDEDNPTGAGGWTTPPMSDDPGKPVFHRSRPTPENPSRRFISCELEIASSNRDTYERVGGAMRAWPGTIAVHDGSLPETGYEINTAPTSGGRFVREIERLCSVLNDCDAEVTVKCGFHVHVDARDYRYEDLQRLVRVYAHVEPALFAVVPPSRSRSIYCVPCGDRLVARGIAAAVAGDYTAAKRAKEARRRVLRGHLDVVNPDTRDGRAGVRAARDSKWHTRRYSALNLQSWFYHGTIECRLAAGTTSVEKIVNWSILWAAILDWCRVHTDADARALADGHPDSFDALLTLAPTDTVRAWLRLRRARFS